MADAMVGSGVEGIDNDHEEGMMVGCAKGLVGGGMVMVKMG